jgi:hypothetical protein
MLERFIIILIGILAIAGLGFVLNWILKQPIPERIKLWLE